MACGVVQSLSMGVLCKISSDLVCRDRENSAVINMRFWCRLFIYVERVNVCDDWWLEWMGSDSNGGFSVTTIEVQDAVHRWSNDLSVRGHLMSTPDIQ